MDKKLISIVKKEDHKFLNLPSLLSPKKSIAKNLYGEPVKEKNMIYGTNNFSSLDFYKNILQNITEADFEDMKVTDSTVGHNI